MSDYHFSPRWKRPVRVKVRECDYDQMPCEYCPRGCEYTKKLKPLESKARGELSLNLRKMVFEAVRREGMRRRAHL